MRRAPAPAPVLLLIVLVVGVALGASGAILARDRHEAPAGFVTRSGREFQLDGRPFRFVGFNLYDAAATERYTCDTRAAMPADVLDTSLAWASAAGGARVVRVWAYQTYTASGRDYSGVDQVLSAARRHGMKVLLVLEDGPGNCTLDAPGQPKMTFEGDSWYTSGYRKANSGAPLSFRDYVRRIVGHYRDDPTVLGWSLMNEAETKARDSAGRSALLGFARDVGGLVKSIDPHHLVTLGTQSNGAPGASGADFEDVYGLDVLDFAEVHDWGRWGSDTTAMPGSADGRTPPDPRSDACRSLTAPIGCSFAEAAVLDKPLLVGEAGIAATDADGRRRRADQLGAKLDAAFAAGAGGYLVWHLSRIDTDTYDVIAGSQDPLLPVLRSAAAKLEGT